MRLEVEIYKARIAAREAGNIRARKNAGIQKAASVAGLRARSALRTQLRMKKLPISAWEEALKLATEEHDKLVEEKKRPQNRSNGMLRFDCSMAYYLVDQLETRRKGAMALEQREVDEVSHQLGSTMLGKRY